MEKEIQRPPVLSYKQVREWCDQHVINWLGQVAPSQDREAQRDADVAYYEPIIKTLRGEPLELSDDWENNLYRNIVHTLVETEGMIPGGQAERVMKVCKALYRQKTEK